MNQEPMRKVLPIIITLLIIFPDYYIWENYITETWAVGSGWFPSISMAVSIIASMLNWYHNTTLRIFFSLVLLSALPKLLFTAIVPWTNVWTALVPALIVIVAFSYGFCFGWRHLIVRRATCASPDLPEAFDGYRVMQLSDVHLGTFGAHSTFIKRIVDTINAQNPDLIVFTGDLVNVSASEVIPYQHVLRKLSAPDGVFSILGNHDYCEYGQDHRAANVQRNLRILEQMEARMGWQLLNNSHHIIYRGEAAIALIGVENIGKPPFPSRGDLPLAMKGLSEGTFKILLSHDPTHWRSEVTRKTDIQLTLSGHTHAAQLRIGKWSPARWAYNEWGGAYTENGKMLHVSPGIGGTVPFRFGAWPEVNLITLKRKQTAGDEQKVRNKR